jgi:molecular chaperone DnaK
MERIVGIDLGTTNSLVAHLVGSRPEIIPSRSGRRLTPSVVGLDTHGHIVVGDVARNQWAVHPERTVAEVKRLMGTTARVQLGTRAYSPTEVSALILKQLKEDAEQFFGEPVPEAVITVPAYFTDVQRQATKDAGEIAGFKVERILNEPTAAALAHGLDHLDAEQHVLVYDLGGGTFDVSVLEMFQGVLDVKATSGNALLGGSDFDRALVEWLCAQIQREHGVDVRGDAGAQARLKAAAEQAKIDVSTAPSAMVCVPFLTQRDGQPLSVELEVTRATVEDLIGGLVRSTLEPVKAALKDARLTAKDITDVVLVGGSSRVPLVRQLVAEFFGREPRGTVNPDEAVALGAAVQAGLKSGQADSENGILISDVCPFTLGVEVSTRSMQAVQRGHFSPIIARNATVPVSRTEIYSTMSHGQSQVDVKVFQGESRLVRDNVFLDQYSVSGIPPAPAGAEKIAITFTYDVNGILDVKTRVLSTGKEARLTVDKNALRLSEAERGAARDRLDREWRAPVAAEGADGTQEPGGEDGASDSRTDLLAAATRRAAGVPDGQRQRIEGLCAELRAAASGSSAARELDQRLTDLLFELG